MTGRSESGTIAQPHSRYNAGVACADLPATLAADRPAIVHEAWGTVARLTFGELARRSSALASRLVAGGAGPGEAVGVHAPAGIDAAIAHIAVLKAGAVTVPLVPLLGELAIEHRLRDSGARLLLCTPELAPGVAPLLDRLPREVRTVPLEGASLEGARGFEPAPTSSEDPAILLHTSGTTGKPKGAVLPHRIVLARQVPLSMIHGPFLPDDVFWTPADWMWVGSLVDSVLGPLSHGCTVMTYERRRFEASGAIERLKALGVTRAFVPPTALRQLIAAPDAEWRGHGLRSMHSGGEQLTADADAWTREVLGIVADEIYGTTEASFLVGNAHRFAPAVRGSMGRPFPGQVVRVADADGEPVPMGEVGELQVAGGSPTLFLGYHDQPEATASRFRDGWFGTGDLVRCDTDGRLYYTGREDDLILSAGHRIGPGEIEDVLLTHHEVAEVIVVGERDAERGQRIKAVVRLRDELADPPAGLTPELQDLVRAQVGRHAYPRSVEYVAEFPRTVTGKVRRDQLRLAPSEREGADPRPAGAGR